MPSAISADLTGKIHRDLRHHIDGMFYEKPLKLTVLRVLRAWLAPEFRVLFWFRVYAHLHRQGWRYFAFWLYQRTKRRFNCDFSPEADIGGGVRLAHCSDIVVGPLAKVGPDAVIFNGVTLGNRLREGEDWSMPQVGSGVLIGSGAKLLGNIVIGDGARIGANAVVLQSVPPGASAVGIPARIIHRLS